MKIQLQTWIPVLIAFFYFSNDSLSQTSLPGDAKIDSIYYAEIDSVYFILWAPQVLDSSGRGRIDKFQFVWDIIVPEYHPFYNGDSNTYRDTITAHISYDECGVKDKVVCYYNSGKKYWELNFNRYGRQGAEIDWYENGTMKSICFYRNDTVISPKVSWYNNGAILGFYDEESGVGKNWYQTGELFEITNSKNKEEVKRIIFERDGSIIEKLGKETDGFRLYENYHTNRQLWKRGKIKDMMLWRVGKWEVWYENGNLQLEAFYHDSIPNVPIGTWKYYNEKGELVKEEIYKEGELKKTKEYLPLDDKKN